MRESTSAWVWQAAVAVPIIVALTGIKPLPRVVVIGLLVLVVSVQRTFPDGGGSRLLRTIVMSASTWVAVTGVVTILAMALTPETAHPGMPIGEVLLGGASGTIGAVPVLYLRMRGRDRWAELDGGPGACREPRLAAVVEVFAAAAVLRVAIDSLT